MEDKKLKFINWARLYSGHVQQKYKNYVILNPLFKASTVMIVEVLRTGISFMATRTFLP